MYSGDGVGEEKLASSGRRIVRTAAAIVAEQGATTRDASTPGDPYDV